MKSPSPSKYFEWIVEDEVIIVQQVHHQGQIVRAGEKRALATGAVEMLVAAVERDGEHTFRRPLEAVLAALGCPHRGRAVAVDHIVDGFEQMLDRRGLAARVKFEREAGDEVAAPCHMQEGALGVEARPRAGRAFEGVEAEILIDR